MAFLFSLGRLRSSVLELGAAYILGIFVVYMLIGLGMLQVLHLFETPHFMAKLGASLLVLLGLVTLANHFVPAFPVKLRMPQFAHGRMAQLMEKSSLPSAFALGGLVDPALAWNLAWLANVLLAFAGTALHTARGCWAGSIGAWRLR